jgi:hypothetical protein
MSTACCACCAPARRKSRERAPLPRRPAAAGRTFLKPDHAPMSLRNGGTNSADATSVEGRTPGRRARKEAIIGRKPAPVG